MGYNNSPDTTYQLSSLTLAAVAEKTCGYIIIGLPHLPRTLSEQKFFRRFVSSIRTWVGSLTSRPANSEKSTGSEDRSGAELHSASKHQYRRMHDADGIPLTDIDRTHSSLSESAQRGAGPQSDYNDILRTTEIEVASSPTTNTIKPSHHTHPWEA